MTMTEVISERSSSVPGESEDDELLTPRVGWRMFTYLLKECIFGYIFQIMVH